VEKKRGRGKKSPSPPPFAPLRHPPAASLAKKKEGGEKGKSGEAGKIQDFPLMFFWFPKKMGETI